MMMGLLLLFRSQSIEAKRVERQSIKSDVNHSAMNQE